MPNTSLDPAADWRQQKPDVQAALGTLLHRVNDPAASGKSIIDAYLYAKSILADAMEALAKSLYEGTSAKFHELRSDLQAEINRRYANTAIPAKYLQLRYGSVAYERLFALLMNYDGPVPSSLVRTLKGDSVHTERRIRELRELGLNITSRQEDGQDLYELVDLSIDFSLIPAIVTNNITTKGRKQLSDSEFQHFIALAQANPA